MHGKAAHSKPLVKKYSIIFPKHIMDLENPCENSIYFIDYLYMSFNGANIAYCKTKQSESKIYALSFKKVFFPKNSW